MLDYSSDEYFVILCYFKTEKRKYNFFKQSVVELACRVQHFTTSVVLRYSNLYASTVYKNALQGTSGLNKKSHKAITLGF